MCCFTNYSNYLAIEETEEIEMEENEQNALRNLTKIIHSQCSDTDFEENESQHKMIEGIQKDS